MIDKLENSYAVGDPIIRGIVNKLNELIDNYNIHSHISSEGDSISSMPTTDDHEEN